MDPKYQTIVMDGNPLERLEKDVFKAAGLVNLQVIQMRNCHLIDVHEHAFRGLVILKEVDIRYVDLNYFVKEVDIRYADLKFLPIFVSTQIKT